MQATALGRYMLYRPDGTFVGADGVGRGTGSRRRLDGRRELRRRLHVLAGREERPRARDRRRGLRGVPGGRAQRDGNPVEGELEYGAGRWLHRGPHALDDVPVLRRQLPLRGAVVDLRHHRRAARLRGQGRAAGHRRAVAERPQLRQSGAAARHARLPDVDAAEQGQPHLRGDLLALGPARVDVGAAGDGHGRQREPRPVRAAGQPRRELQRDGRRCGVASPRCARWRTTSTRRRRAGQGLLPDRRGPDRGAARRQLGPDGGAPRDRALRAVRLRQHRDPDVRPRHPSTSSSTSSTRSACARRS